ncbi:MAG: SDR family oxidoreductase [Mucilaginibacter polytrichastri]|nr:SDR family oxidoreductase [Mucilaginibacter polytrichastri]
MKTALITGASKGIGRAMALKLATECSGFALCARRTAPLLRLKTELEVLNPNVRVYTSETDCSRPEELRTFIENVDRIFPAVDYLVNNLGIYTPADIFSDTDDVLKTQMDNNLYPAYALCRHYGAKMRLQRSGLIINLGSTASFDPVTEAAAYSVTKFAVRGLTDVLRQSLQGSGVQVIGVYPGSTRTASWENEAVPADLKLLEPDEVADAVWQAIQKGEKEVHIKPVSP